MPDDYVIRSFLLGNRAEVKDMCITEYNELQTMQMFREEGREEGWEEGQIELLKKMIRSGDMPVEKAAAYVGMTVEEFCSYKSSN